MLGILTNLTKAVISVSVAPVAAVVDVVTLPDSACDVSKGPFDRTAALLKNAGECVGKAVKPE